MRPALRRTVAFAVRAAAAVARFAPAPCLASVTPTAVAHAARTEVTVGETFTVEVRASGPAGITFEFPPEATQETFELRTAKAPPNAKGAPIPPPPGTHVYQATVFTVGDAEIPAIPVRFRLADGTAGEIATAPISLRVVSLLPKEKAEQKLADVRAPLGVAVGRAFWNGASVLAVLLAALAWWIVARRRRVTPAVVAPAPPVEPADEARQALEALVASGRLARAEHRLFYIDLTAIAKRYLERRLKAPIVEMTTAEMLAHLKSDPLGLGLAPTLCDLSGAADRIKFARGSGLLDEAERHLAATRAMIDAVEARLERRPKEGGQAA